MRTTLGSAFALSFSLFLAACGGDTQNTDTGSGNDASSDVARDTGGTDVTAPQDVAMGVDAVDATTGDDVQQPSDVTQPTDVQQPADVAASDVQPGDACTRITEDTSAIGNTCSDNTDCPTGYTCRSFSGIVLQQRCEIICQQSCQCPNNYACQTASDKGGSWMQCNAIGSF